MGGLVSWIVPICIALICGPAAAQISVSDDGKGHTTVRSGDTTVERTFDVVEGASEPLAIGRLSAALANIPLTVPPEFSDKGEVVVHTATGIRLPKTHERCRLVALEPSQDHAGAATSFAEGAVAEYDCRPSESLTYVLVAFRANTSFLKDHDLAYALPRLANAAVQLDAKVSNDACHNMDVPPQSPFAGLAVAQCGVRWGSHAEAEPHTYGTAAMAIGHGSSFMVFSNTCVDAQCDSNRPEFGKFILSFDVSALRDGPKAHP